MNDLTPTEIEALTRVMGNLSIGEDPFVEPENLIKERKSSSGSEGQRTISRAQFMQLQEKEVLEGVPNPIETEQLQSVKIEIEVVLGRTKLPIKTLLNLHEGAVLPLDKLAGEPVEILANGTLIAYGEVVVVDNYFGVRVIQKIK